MSLTRIMLAIGLMASTVSAQPALATQLPDPVDYCDTPRVLAAVKDKVDYKFRGVTKTKLFLLKITSPKTVRDTIRDEEHNVARKYCHGTAHMNDRVKRDIWYLIEYPFGFAGIPMLSNTEFCISGLDPWKIYGRDCASLR